MRACSISLRRRGFAYVEVLLAVTLLTIMLVPALDALTNGVRGSTVQPLQRHLALRNKLEEVLSKPYSELDSAAMNAGNNTNSTGNPYTEASGTPGPAHGGALPLQLLYWQPDGYQHRVAVRQGLLLRRWQRPGRRLADAGGQMVVAGHAPKQRSRQTGMSMLELTIAVVIGAVVLLGLNSLVSVPLRAGTEVHGVNELGYQAQSAMERIADKVRAATPFQLAPVAAGSTGTWLAPVMFCRNAVNNQLIETVTSDGACSGTAVIANGVTAFTATLPTMGPLDRHSAIFSISLADGNGHTLTVSAQLRLGGGTR